MQFIQPCQLSENELFGDGGVGVSAFTFPHIDIQTTEGVDTWSGPERLSL